MIHCQHCGEKAVAPDDLELDYIDRILTILKGVTETDAYRIMDYVQNRVRAEAMKAAEKLRGRPESPNIMDAGSQQVHPQPRRN